MTSPGAWVAPDHAPTAQDIDDLPEILTAAQAAWMLRLSVRALDAARKREVLAGFKLGKSWRYSKAQLLATIRNA